MTPLRATARRRVVRLVALHVLGSDTCACHRDTRLTLLDTLSRREAEWLDDLLDLAAVLASAEANPVVYDDVLPLLDDAGIEEEIDMLVQRAFEDEDAPAPAHRSAFAM